MSHRTGGVFTIRKSTLRFKLEIGLEQLALQMNRFQEIFVPRRLLNGFRFYSLMPIMVSQKK
jgi:hypothetical protein